MGRRGIGSQVPASRPSPGPQEEVALVSRVASGDVVAFDALFRRYAPRLMRFLGRTTRVTHLIDEIVDDTMLVVWRKAGTFNGSSKVSTWILGIASRRRMKALQRGEDSPVAADADEMADSEECGPEGQFMRQELRRSLSDAIAALPEEQRRVVMLTFEGHTYAEIAQIVGCPVNTVKTRMFHARRRLRAILADGRRAA